MWESLHIKEIFIYNIPTDGGRSNSQLSQSLVCSPSFYRTFFCDYQSKKLNMFSSASVCSVCEQLLEMVMWSKLGNTNASGMQFSLTGTVAARNHVQWRQTWVLEGQFLHEEVDPGVYLKAVKVVCVSLQPHEEATVGHIGRAERGSIYMQIDLSKQMRGDTHKIDDIMVMTLS